MQSHSERSEESLGLIGPGITIRLIKQRDPSHTFRVTVQSVGFVILSEAKNLSV